MHIVRGFIEKIWSSPGGQNTQEYALTEGQKLIQDVVKAALDNMCRFGVTDENLNKRQISCYLLLTDSWSSIDEFIVSKSLLTHEKGKKCYDLIAELRKSFNTLNLLRKGLATQQTMVKPVKDLMDLQQDIKEYTSLIAEILFRIKELTKQDSEGDDSVKDEWKKVATYMIEHWNGLTQFMTTSGGDLDKRSLICCYQSEKQKLEPPLMSRIAQFDLEIYCAPYARQYGGYTLNCGCPEKINIADIAVTDNLSGDLSINSLEMTPEMVEATIRTVVKHKNESLARSLY